MTSISEKLTQMQYKRPGDVGSNPIRGIQPIFLEEYVERGKKSCPYTYMFNSFHCHINFVFLLLYKNPGGFLSRYAYSNEERLGPRDHPQ